MRIFPALSLKVCHPIWCTSSHIYIMYIYIRITQFGAQHVPTNLLNLEHLKNECANLRGMIEIWLQVAHGK